MPTPHRWSAAPPDTPAAQHRGHTAPPDAPAAPRGRLAALLDRQAGVVGRAQALAAGLAPREVDRLLARRLWHPVHPRVYRAAGYPLTDEARVRAAALWGGDGAVVVGAAAVWWHGLQPDGYGSGKDGVGTRAPRTVAIVVPRRCPAPRPGVAARRRRLLPVDIVTVRGLAVPVRPLALLDAAVEAGAAGIPLLGRALRADAALTERELRAVAASSAGAASARRLIAAVTSTASPSGRSNGTPGVTSAPSPPCGEWPRSRNRYSEL